MDQYIFLYPPEAKKDGTVFTFTNNTQNDPSVFLGFRLLYRFYPSIEAVNSGISAVSSRYSSSPTTIYSAMKNSLGFRDLKIGTDDRLVIEPLSRESVFSIELDFAKAIQNSGDKMVEIYVSEGSTGTSPSLPDVVYRNVPGQSEIGFSSDNLKLGYDDLISGENYDLDGNCYLQLYILAYGLSISDSSISEVYSQPRYFIGTSYLSFKVEQ